MMPADDSFHYEIGYAEIPPSEGRDSRGSKVTTIWCHGRLVSQYKDQIQDIFQHTALHGHIYFDLNDVTYLDSAGLGALVRVKFQALKQDGVSVKLVNVGPRVMQMLKVTNLLQWFSS
jgi:anti-anti-sigma factor